MIKNADREAAYVILIEHMNSLKRKDLSAAQKAKLDEIMYDANVFIANTEMTVDQLEAYVTKVMARMDEVAENVPKAEQFLFIDNRSEITSAKYGEATSDKRREERERTSEDWQGQLHKGSLLDT